MRAQADKRLAYRISLLVTFAVMLVLFIVGVYFNHFLKNNFREKSYKQIQNSFQRLSDNLLKVEGQLVGGISFAKNDESLIAAMSLLNEYQDKKAYNTYLIDEEKKQIAEQLFNQVKLTFNSDIRIYDARRELQVYVREQADGYVLNYTTYTSGELTSAYRHENSREFIRRDHLPEAERLYAYAQYYQAEQLGDQTVTHYFQKKGYILVQVYQNILNDEQDEVIAHVEMAKVLDETYFRHLSMKFGTHLSFSHDSQYEAIAAPLTKWMDQTSLTLVEIAGGYRCVVKYQGHEGPLYFIAEVSSQELEELLKKNRQQFLVLLAVVAVVALLLTRLLIHYTISVPLSVLMRQVEQIRDQDYSTQKEVTSRDELALISSSINHLATVIQSREAELKESITQIRTLIEALPDLVWLKDHQGLYLSCNQKFERLYGLKEAALVGKNDYELIDTTSAEQFCQHDEAALLAGQPVMHEETLIYSDDGHEELVETIRTPIYAADGQPVAVLAIARDITERRQNEEALRRTQKMEAVGQLTGGIAHDFNNILGIILGNVELLQLTSSESEKGVKMLAAIKKAAKRAATLTKQLLGFSRHHEASTERVDLNQAIKEMKNMISRSVTPSIEIIESLSPTLWLTEINAGDFQDALINLIINARDAMKDQGSGKISFTTQNCSLDADFCRQRRDVTPGNYVRLTVRDSGSGIAPEMQDKIFEPFFTTKERGKGTGLGLAMVFGFIKRSKGYIELASTLSEGTCFSLYLPCSEEQLATQSLTSSMQITLPRGTETILVVDDEVALVALLEVTLTQLGYQVVSATNGQQALAQLASESDIALLITDVIMPGGINGYELANEALRADPQLQVLFCSGYTQKEMVKGSSKDFSSQLISKPYSQVELAQRVRSILDSCK